jgi:hypothetical protein
LAHQEGSAGLTRVALLRTSRISPLLMRTTPFAVPAIAAFDPQYLALRANRL